jgi:hypothetical protein
LAPVVAERRSDLADALEQAVVAHMDVRPDRCDQVLLAEGPSGVGGKQRQHLECFRPKLDGFAAGTAQLDALLIQFKTRKAEHHAFPGPSTGSKYQKCNLVSRLRRSLEFSACSEGNF